MKHLVENVFKLAGMDMPEAFCHVYFHHRQSRFLVIEVLYKKGILELRDRAPGSGDVVEISPDGPDFKLTSEDWIVVHAAADQPALMTLEQCFTLGFPGKIIGLLRQAAGDPNWAGFFSYEANYSPPFR